MSFIKNLYIILLFFQLNIDYILSKSSDFPFLEDAQQKILDDACLNIHPIFCPMSKAIEQIFLYVQNELISSNNNNLYSDLVNIQYNNVYGRDIICENINPFIDNSTSDEIKYKIQFIDCNVLIEGNIILNNADYSSINFGIFLSELKFDTITFCQNKTTPKGELDVLFEYNNEKLFNYNRNESFFISSFKELLRFQMDDIMKNIFENYMERIKIRTKVEEGKISYLSDKLNVFNKEISLISGPPLNSINKSVTYIAYNNFNYENYINVNGKVFLNELNVSFEYALNNNITYNEGFFVLKNITFDENVTNKNIYDDELYESKADFNNYLEETNIKFIWNTIFNDFKDKLNEYRKKMSNLNSKI